MSDTKSDLETAKEVTRELHESIKDAKQTIKDLDAAGDRARQAWESIRGDIEAKIEAEVTSEIEHMNDQIAAAIDQSADEVYARFDRMIAIMLGLEEGQVPIAEQLAKLNMNRRQQVRLAELFGTREHEVIDIRREQEIVLECPKCQRTIRLAPNYAELMAQTAGENWDGKMRCQNGHALEEMLPV